jgi:hypothetical protein
MASLEFMVPKAESEAFNTAVYRFIELRSAAVGEHLPMLQSDPHGPVDRKKVTLWDDAALMDFTSFWASFRAAIRAGRAPMAGVRPA